jgi:hypothetical protein
MLPGHFQGCLRQYDGATILAAGDSNRTRLLESNFRADQNKITDKEVQVLRSSLAFSSVREGVCSAQIQGQNKHRRERPSIAGGFADIDIAKGSSIYL